MPSDRISVDTVGTQQRITFDFGTLINMDGDANEELVDLEFNVLVLNTVDTNAGDVKTNAFEVWTGGALVDTSEPVAVTIVEPLIDDLTKELVSSPPFDAGDLVTFRLTHSNTGTAPALNRANITRKNSGVGRTITTTRLPRPTTRRARPEAMASLHASRSAQVSWRGRILI